MLLQCNMRPAQFHSVHGSGHAEVIFFNFILRNRKEYNIDSPTLFAGLTRTFDVMKNEVVSVVLKKMGATKNMQVGKKKNIQ